MRPIALLAMLSITNFIRTAGKALTFTTYWQHDEGVTMNQATITGIANSFHMAIGAVWKGLADTQAIMFSTRAVYMKGDIFADAFSDATAIAGTEDGAGADLQDAMGDDIALVLQRRTGLRGRRYRGRIFVPGLSEEINSNGYLESNYEVEADALAAVLGADHTVTDGPATDTVWHARHYSIGPRDPDTKLPLTAAEFVPVTDVRWVNKLSTRKDRIIHGTIIAR